MIRWWKKQSKKKKVIIICFLIFLLLAIVALVLVLCLKDSNQHSHQPSSSSTSQYVPPTKHTFVDQGFELYLNNENKAVSQDYLLDHSNVVIPSTVHDDSTPYSFVTIGENTFEGDSLVSLTIPTSITKIEYHAFNACSNFGEITYLGSVEDWDLITIDSQANYDNLNVAVYCTNGYRELFGAS